MKATLTQDQVDALQRWIDEAVPIMRLAHWRITAAAEPPGENGEDDDGFAGSFINDSSDTGRVHLADKFWGQDAVGQRETLTHELLHFELFRLRDFIGDRLKGTDLRTAMRMEEVAIEQLSRIIAPLLPFPEIPPR